MMYMRSTTDHAQFSKPHPSSSATWLPRAALILVGGFHTYYHYQVQAGGRDKSSFVTKFVEISKDTYICTDASCIGCNNSFLKPLLWKGSGIGRCFCLGGLYLGRA